MTPQERKEFITEIAMAFKEAVPVTPSETVLTDDEVRALKLLIKKQEQSIALRQSIIEKSLTALMVAGFLGAFAWAWTGAVTWVSQHVYRP